jgi:D-3-phosphoglycerate dehydrogenase
LRPDPRPKALAPSRRTGDDDFFAPTRTELAKAGAELILAPYSTLDELLPIAQGNQVEAIYQGPVPMSRPLFEQLPSLKAICALGIGVDDFDLQAATDHGVVVINIPRVFHREVAQHTWALLLALVRQIVPLNAAMHERAHHPTANLRPAVPRQHLYGQTLGLVAFGNIARVVAQIARSFELRVIAYDPYATQEAADPYGVTLVTNLDQLLQESDFVSMHTPLTADTFHLMGETQFRQMKPSALFVNTSRGKTVDEPALIKALNEGWIAGAALDVTEIEPPRPDNPLLTLPNVILTPHIASASDRARVERARWMGIEVGRVLNGLWPIHGLVNRGVTPKAPLRSD